MKKTNVINYKLKLSNKIKIYPIFYISLLKSANPTTPAYIKKSPGLAQNDKYEIKKITEYDSQTQQYIIK